MRMMQVRRERISERMRYLQELVPGCDKVTGKAGMLDEIINYVQSLQRQVEVTTNYSSENLSRQPEHTSRILALNTLVSGEYNHRIQITEYFALVTRMSVITGYR